MTILANMLTKGIYSVTSYVLVTYVCDTCHIVWKSETNAGSFFFNITREISTTFHLTCTEVFKTNKGQTRADKQREKDLYSPRVCNIQVSWKNKPEMLTYYYRFSVVSKTIENSQQYQT